MYMETFPAVKLLRRVFGGIQRKKTITTTFSFFLEADNSPFSKVVFTFLTYCTATVFMRGVAFHEFSRAAKGFVILFLYLKEQRRHSCQSGFERNAITTVIHGIKVLLFVVCLDNCSNGGFGMALV